MDENRRCGDGGRPSVHRFSLKKHGRLVYQGEGFVNRLPITVRSNCRPKLRAPGHRFSPALQIDQNICMDSPAQRKEQSESSVDSTLLRR